MRRLVAVALLWAGTGCGGGEAAREPEAAPETGAAPVTQTAAPAPTAWTPAEVGSLAAAIALRAEAADSILAAHGLDALRFDSLVYDIAADSAATAEYLAALNR